MQKLVIKRSEWWRGHSGQASRLMREEDGQKCCLGFLALQCGHTEDEITEVSDPYKLYRNLASVYGLFPANFKMPISLVNHQSRDFSSICADLMVVNDVKLKTPEYLRTKYTENRIFLKSEAERETLLAELFREIGIEVEYVD